MKQWLKGLWWTMCGLCPSCGGRLNTVYGFGPEHCRREGNIFVWCPLCHMYCRCVREEEKST